MKKKFRHNDYYENYDNEDEYHSAGIVPSRQSIPQPIQAIAPPTPAAQEERPKPNYPKYCFV